MKRSAQRALIARDLRFCKSGALRRLKRYNASKSMLGNSVIAMTKHASSRLGMRIVFFIALHRFEHQFEWLFNAISNPRDIFLIHVDETSPEPFLSEIRRITAGCPNVTLVPRRPITWGGWSLVKMALEAIRHASMQYKDWRYFVLLSGQDYPIRPIEDLRTFLKGHDGSNFIQMKHLATQPFHIRRRLHWYCVEHGGRLHRLPLPNLRAMLSAVEWYGNFWCMLSREFCNWLVASRSTRSYSRALRHTKIPDEFFFQTMITQSPFAGTLDRDFRRYMQFEGGSPSPKTLTSQDLGHLTRSRAFFARKFDESVDAAILRQLAWRIGAKIPQAA